MSMGQQYSCPGAHGGLWRFEDSADDILGRITNTYTTLTYDGMGRFTKGTLGNGARRATFGYTYLKPTVVTATFWYKGTTPGDDCVIISDMVYVSSKYYGFFVGFDAATHSIGIVLANGQSSWSFICVGTTACDDGKWHFICCTYDGSNAKTYIDGVLEKTTAKGAYGLSFYSYIYPALLCYHETSASYLFHITGLIDDLAIYNYAWTDSEVRRWWAHCNGKLV